MMKKRMKRICSMLLTLVMAISLFSGISMGEVKAAETSGNCGKNTGTDVQWSYDAESKTLTFTGTGEMKDYVSFDMTPWVGYKNDVENVVIGEGVTNVGSSICFSYTNLKSVTLPSTLTKIGYDAFAYAGYGVGAFTTITLPAGVVEIGNRAFASAVLKTIICESSTPARLGENVFKAASEPDYQCFLTSIQVPSDSVETYKTSWSEYADVIQEEAVTSGNCGKPANEEDPATNNITWSYDAETTTLTFTGIGAMADYVDKWASSGTHAPWEPYAGEITTVEIGSGITSIGTYAFYGCGNLETVTFPNPNTVNTLSTFAFGCCESIEEIIIPFGVRTIGKDAFYYCGLKKVTIPATVSNIGDGAFVYCNNLETVIMEGNSPATLVTGQYAEKVFTGPCVQEAAKTSSTQGIFVPKAAVSTYKSRWTDYADYIKANLTDAEKVAEAKEALQTALENIEVSNDTTKESLEQAIQAALTEAEITGVGVTIGDDFAKTAATTEEEGKVTGTVTLTAGTVTDTIALNLTIAKLPNVSGGVTGGAGSTFEITIKKGNEVVMTTVADGAGQFDFSGIPDGIYNIVVVETTSTGAKKVVTGVIEVKSGEITDTASIAVDDSQTEVSVAEQAPDVVAGGLDKLYTNVPQEVTDQGVDLAQIVADGGTTKVVLNVEKAENTEVILALQTEAERQNKVLGTGFDAEVLLRIAESAGTVREINVSDTQALIHMVMPLADGDKGKTGYQVFRSHVVNGAEEITALPELTGALQTAPAGEGFCVDGDKIHIWANKFSTYVVAYDSPSTPDTPSGDPNGGGNTDPTPGDPNGGGNTDPTPGDPNGGGNTDPTPGDPNGGGNTDPTPGDPNGNGNTNPTPGNSNGNGNTNPAPVTPDETVSAETLQENALALNAKLKVSQTGKQIKVTWGKVPGAEGYDVYVQYCNKGYNENSLNSVTGSTTKLSVKKVDGKKLNVKKDYKVYVEAYKLVKGKKVSLGKSITAHVAGNRNAKYTNPKRIKLKKKSFTLKVGKKAKIKASVVLVNKGKKQLSKKHEKQFRYATSDEAVATVSSKGKIKAVGKGTCVVYVYARNGYAKKIKVKVK